MNLPNLCTFGRLSAHVLYLITVISIFSSAVFAAKTNTFLMLTGTEYKNVPYRVMATYKVVEITVDGTKMNLSYADIATIYDSTGQDVTKSVIGRTSRAPQTQTPAKDSVQTEAQATGDSIVAQPETEATDSATSAQPVLSQPEAKPVVTAPLQQQQEPWVSKEEKNYQEAQKSKWSFIVSGFGNYTLPVGDYYEGVDGAIGFEGEILIPVSREVGIGAIVAKPGISTDLFDLDLSLWKYFFTVYYLVETNERKNLVYFTTGAGVTVISADGSGSSETNFTIPFKVNILLPLGETFGFNIGAGYDMSFVKGYTDDGDEGVAYAHEFNLRAGLSLAIPRKSKE